MKRGTDNASLFGESFGSEQQGYSSNMKLMMIIASFLIVTIGLILVQPNVAPNQLAENEPTELTKTADLANVPSANYSNFEAVVTLSETSLLSIGGIERAEDVSKLLRQPFRLNGATRDIRPLSREVLASFGYNASAGDRLHGLLVQALAEGQSDTYIDALLNTAVTRGDFRALVALTMPSGRFTTDALLQELVLQFNN
ncbi:MAG: hypothetical protein QMB38_08895 [Ascidiaceihabitans sp.]